MSWYNLTGSAARRVKVDPSRFQTQPVTQDEVEEAKRVNEAANPSAGRPNYHSLILRDLSVIINAPKFLSITNTACIYNIFIFSFVS